MGTKGESDGGSVFAWVFWSMAKVNKGMRTVSDSVWRWGHAPFPAKMDTLNTLLLGWLFFALLLIVLAKFLYDKYLSGGDDLSEEYFTNGSEREEPKLPKGGCLGPAPNQVSKTPSIVPAKAPARNSAPLATGGEPDAVKWINNLLIWFYEGSEGGHVIRENWNDALNEFTVGAALEAGVLVEVLEFFPQTPPPNLTNIIVDCDPTDNMTVTCDMEQTIYLRVQTTRTQREVTTESEYACAVRPLRGRLNIAVETHQCAAFIKFDGWPEVQLEFEGIRNNSSGLDEEQLQEVVSEVLVAALRKVNLHLDFLNHKNFPRFSRARSVPDQVIPVGYDSLAHSRSSPVGIVGLNGKRLLVKVVKASGLGADDSVDSSYAVVEMDEPSQRFTTAAVSESTAPFWDEQFLFDLSENTLELLFEIYDKSNDRFLGLGIVGIEELVATPSQRQIIPLQARPYENDKVSGSLTCEFLFLDRADLPDLTLRAGSGGVSQSSPRLRTTMTTYVKPLDETASDEGTADVAVAAIKDLEERQSMPLNQQKPSAKSTMIIHASRKPMDDPRFEGPASVSTPRATHVSQTPSSPNKSGSFRQASSIKALPTEISPEIRNTNDQPSPSVPDVEERSRSRNRGRDFFGSIRRRFSRSKNRSKSVEPTNNVGLRTADLPLERDPLAGRSVSVERSSTVARSRGFLSVPGKNRSSSSGLAGDSGSTRSSLSGASGLSSASTKTYINEASLLVVETLENGIIKHYLVPLTLQRKNKWRKKGTKLHIYNEHTFVAKHMSSSVSCEVCNKALARRIGKQGYECRDCSFKCHKPCHVKAETPCPNSTVNTMDLVYVKDERAERKKAARSS